MWPKGGDYAKEHCWHQLKVLPLLLLSKPVSIKLICQIQSAKLNQTSVKPDSRNPCELAPINHEIPKSPEGLLIFFSRNQKDPCPTFSAAPQHNALAFASSNKHNANTDTQTQTNTKTKLKNHVWWMCRIYRYLPGDAHPLFPPGWGWGCPTWSSFTARISYAARAMIAQPRPRPPRRLNWNSSEAARDQFGL